MEENYYLTSQKTFLIALSLTWAKFAIKTLSSWEIDVIFETSREVSATVRNFREGFYNYPHIFIHNTYMELFAL